MLCPELCNYVPDSFLVGINQFPEVEMLTMSSTRVFCFPSKCEWGMLCCE